jgi:iron(III) transport system substrate-binding protein
MHTPPISTARAVTALVLTVTLIAAACSDDAGSGESLTVYSGRSEDLIGPLIQRFEEQTGISVSVRYASSTDLAATIREEGANSPADVFFAQDPASLGAVAEAGLFRALPTDLVGLVPAAYADAEGRWVGVSARSRVVVYDTQMVSPDDLPASVDGFTDPQWRGRLAIAPGNASFIAFVAAMILERGDAATLDWLRAVAANQPQLFSGNSPIVSAVDEGAVEVGLVNHYYLLGLRSEIGETRAENHFFMVPGPGSLVMPAGVGILASSTRQDAALRFVEFLLSAEAQQYFADETFEYPMTGEVPAPAALPPFEALAHPPIDLSDLAGVLDRATELISEAGLL